MPGGQWIAFEGYETIHDCRKPPAKEESSNLEFKPQTESQLKSYDELDFVQFRIGSDKNPAKEKEISDSSSISTTGNTSNVLTGGDYSKPTKVPLWGWLLIAIVLLVLLVYWLSA